MKKYVLRITKKGKEWKEFTSGVNWMDDECGYQMEWYLDDFISYIRAWMGLLMKRPHIFKGD